MKRIGLAIAAAMLGTTGVASAAMSVHQFTLSSTASPQSVALDAKTQNLAANCWVATGAGKAASCSTAASLPGVSLPGLPLDKVTGLVNPQALLDEVKGVAGAAAGQAVGTAGSAPGTATAAAGAATNAATGAVNAATNAVNGVVNSATGVVNGAVGTATGVVNGAVGTATGVVNGAVGAVNGVVNG